MNYSEYMANTGSMTPVIDVSSWRYIPTQEDEKKYAEMYGYAHLNQDHIQIDLETVVYQVSDNIQQPMAPITKHQALVGEPIVPYELDDQRNHPAPGPAPDPSGGSPTWDVI